MADAEQKTQEISISMENVYLQKQHNSQNTDEDCEICFQLMIYPYRKFENECDHSFCTSCIAEYIKSKLEENVSNIKCPDSDCEHYLDPHSCRPIIARQVFDKWCDVLCESAVLGFDKAYCPNKKCLELILNECDGKGRLKRCVCPNCREPFCFRCKGSWHSWKWCRRNEEDVALGLLMEKKRWKRCPWCRHVVELHSGCPFILCRCGMEFCYECGKKASDHVCDCRRSLLPWWFFPIGLIILFLYIAATFAFDLMTR